jgi:predicted RNA-binding Zn-ribbon protein involved in translation (DUF1610 family)
MARPAWSVEVVCTSCGRAIAPGRGYACAARGQRVLRCGRCAVRHGPIVRTAAWTALVVGTVLTAINQGDALLSHHVTAALLWKIPLTYFVPFAVSSYSALAISRVQQ